MAYIDIKTDLKHLFFSSDIPDIEIECTVDFFFELLSVTGDIYLSERYNGANQSITVIEGLSDVITSVLRTDEHKTGSFVVRVRTDRPATATQEKVDKPLQCYYCDASIDVGADDFLTRSFMTTHLEAKALNIQSLDMLYWKKTPGYYPGSGVELLPCVVTATYADDYHRLSSDEFPSDKIDEDYMSGFYHRFTVSPQKYLSKDVGKRLVQLSVSVGDRLRNYSINYAHVTSSFAFENIFGLLERVDFYGETVMEVESPREEGAYNRVIRSTRSNFEKGYTVKTGPLSPYLATWLEEMAYSQNTYIILDGEPAPVALRDTKIERSTSLSEFPEMEFSYIFSDRRSQLSISIPRDIGVFDETFNDTFQ